jgi:hypothetical protein
MIKELENARNCLHSKQLNQSKLNSCVEIVELVPTENHINDVEIIDVESDLERC